MLSRMMMLKMNGQVAGVAEWPFDDLSPGSALRSIVGLSEKLPDYTPNLRHSRLNPLDVKLFFCRTPVGARLIFSMLLLGAELIFANLLPGKRRDPSRALMPVTK